MDGSVAAPLSRDDLRDLCRRSDLIGALQLGRHGAIIAVTATGVAWSGGSWWLAPTLFLHGVALVFLFAQLHETIHRTAFQSRRANLAIAWICGLVLTIPPTDFRHFHWAHHRHTQDPARDPELSVPKPARLVQYLILLSGLPFWRDRATALIRQAFGKPDAAYLPARDHRKVAFEARIFLSLYGGVSLISIATGSLVSVLYWVVPVLLAQPVLRAFLLAEHTGCQEVPEMTLNTRTTLTGVLVRLLGWNMPYHAEHHLHPSVPFHALPRLHTRLVDRLSHVTPGYRAAHREIRATLR